MTTPTATPALIGVDIGVDGFVAAFALEALAPAVGLPEVLLLPGLVVELSLTELVPIESLVDEFALEANSYLNTVTDDD